MTGEFVETPNIMSGSGLLNIHTLMYDPLALDYAGIRLGQLGRLVSYREPGALNARCAKLLGIPAGIPVVPPHADGALNQIANGAAAVGRMTLSVGTSGAIRLTTDRPVLPEGRQLWCYYGVADWMSGASVSGACNVIDWFVRRFMGGRTDFVELDAREGRPEDLPVFLPFLYGERNPGWRDERMGQFLDIRPEHTAGDMYRALQAGILFNLFQCYEVLAQNAGAPDEILVSGGILNSRLWTQMTADIFRRRIRCVQNKDASSVGAAVLAMHAAGALDGVRSYAREAESAVDVLPREEYVRGYDALYRRYLEYYAMFNR
jgi:gluconokinase